MATPPSVPRHGIDVKSLLIPGEDRRELEALAAAYMAEYQPSTPTQRHYVVRLITCDWFRRRFCRIQAEVFTTNIEREKERGAYNPVAAAGRHFLSDCRTGDALVKLFRQMNANDRTYDQALKALERLRDDDPQPVSAPRPQPDPPAAVRGVRRVPVAATPSREAAVAPVLAPYRNPGVPDALTRAPAPAPDPR